MKELEIKIEWENDVSFSVTEKHDANPVSTVLSLDENGDISVLWAHVQKVLEIYWKNVLNTIGEEMKS